MNDNEQDDRPSTYEVGYCKPPPASRFQKGRSGNPAGRPRRQKPAGIATGFGSQAAQEMLLAEAYRPVTLREGDKLIELPALQAIFRSMGVQALKGSRLAATALATMVKTVETEHHRLKFEHFGKAIDYKQDWEQRFAACDAAGVARPEPLPHPDDVHIDPNTGDVAIRGPKCPEEKKKWDSLLARRNEAQEEVRTYGRMAKNARDPERKLLWKQQALYEQRLFDIINDGLPERYKTKLEGRFWRKEDLELIPPHKPKRLRSA